MSNLAIKKVFLIVIVFNLGGCSWITSKRSLFGSEEDSKDKVESAPSTVSKEQYDQLLKKYEALMDERKKENVLKENEVAQGNEVPSSEVHNQEGKLVEDLTNAKLKSELAETVDAFGKEAPSSSAQPSLGDGSIEQQIKQLHVANNEIDSNKIDAAMGHLKELENSPNGQIRVRAKMMIGDLLIKQNEFDLAMQVFEGIIRKDAFSGTVLKALGRLVVCTEKLKLDAKKEQYFSMLHDFFENGM